MSRKTWCWAVFASALVLRLAWFALLLVSSHRHIGASDSLFYDQSAWNIAHGRGYSFEGYTTALHPPLYPLLLAAVYAAAGHSQSAAQLTGIVLSAAVPTLTYLAASGLGFGESVARLSAVIMAVYPSQIFYSTFVGSEALCALLVVAAVAAAVTNRWILAALLTGAAALTRSEAFAIAPVLVCCLVAQRSTTQSSTRRKIAALTLTPMLIVATLLPWAVRNEHAIDSPIFTSTGDGYSLWIGNSPGANGYYRGIPADVKNELPSYHDELRWDEALRRRAISWAAHHPLDVLVLAPRKLYYLFVPDISGLSFGRAENPSSVMNLMRYPLAIAAEVFNASVLALAALSARRLWARHRFAALVLGLTFAVFVGGVLVTHAENRFRIPFAWLFVIPAALELASLDVTRGFVDRLTGVGRDADVAGAGVARPTM